jgi:hypothetical protein
MAIPTDRPPPCDDIGEDIIEMHAMDKLQDRAALQHVASCISCMERVSEHRTYIEVLKRELKEYS